MNFDWNELAFGDKKPLKDLRGIFIVAPRSMSAARLTQIVKTYLPQGNIVLGIAKEPYVLGLEEQPQFTMLTHSMADPLVKKIAAAKTPHTLSTLTYAQRDLPFILQKIPLSKVVLVNGSWKQLFHTLPAYYVLATKRIDYEMISPFISETEARDYEHNILPPEALPPKTYNAEEMLALAGIIAKRSFDYGFQTGVIVGRKEGVAYRPIVQGFNRVVPYQTYAMHHGASRETNFSPMHDLNHYDTIHAEVDIILRAQKQGIDLHDTTLFINLLPCPNCARMFTQTDIAEFVYREDHSDGYAVKMLELAGKKVTRIVR